jgi:DNA-binding transcriptional LysR family regulator
MDINYELLKIFNSVAKEGSISKAAELLHISQPAVTQSIHTLENNLGGILFIRTPKGVVLTNEGNELYSYIKEGVSYFNNGINKFDSLKKLETGTIKIGASAITSEYFLMPYIKEFTNKYPNIKISITNGLTENLIKDLRNGTLDIIITSEIKDKDLSFNKLIVIEDIFVGNNNFKNKTFDINKDKLIIQKNPSEIRKNFDNYIKNNNINPNIYMEIVSHNLLVKYTIEGFGISLVTKDYIKEYLNKELFEIKTDIKLPKRNIGYSIKNNSIPSFATKEFINILNNKKQD